jgi:hypothetical protein
MKIKEKFRNTIDFIIIGSYLLILLGIVITLIMK